jgi:hypothetical protein
MAMEATVSSTASVRPGLPRVIVAATIGACRVVLFARILRGNLRQRAPVLSQRLIERPNILFIDGVCFFLAFPRILKAFPDHGACPFIVQKHKHRSVGPQSWCHVQILS